MRVVKNVTGVRAVLVFALFCAGAAGAWAAQADVQWRRATNLRVIAPAGASPDARAVADFVCTGTNDERVINAAIAELTRGGTVQLLDGDYYVDAFDQEGHSAICLGFNNGNARTITLKGTTENKSYNTRFGVTIHVTKRAMDGMTPGVTYRVFFGAAEKPPARGDFFTYTHVNNANFSNFYLFFDNASRNLIGFDGRNFGSMELDLVGIYQKSYFDDRFLHIGAPSIPCDGTVGVYSVPGNNDEMARGRYNEVNVGGLYRGFVMDGVDHLVMTGCCAARCVYGYWFEKGSPKTMTMINCCDEGNTHLPFFRRRPEAESIGHVTMGHVTMIDFNIERFNAKFIPVDCTGRPAGQCATEETPGLWRGFISYTLQGGAFGFGGRDFWTPGHGTGFRTERLDRISKQER